MSDPNPRRRQVSVLVTSAAVVLLLFTALHWWKSSHPRTTTHVSRGEMIPQASYGVDYSTDSEAGSPEGRREAAAGNASARIVLVDDIPIRNKVILVSLEDGAPPIEAKTDAEGLLRFECSRTQERATFQARWIHSRPRVEASGRIGENGSIDFGTVTLGEGLSGVVVSLPCAEALASLEMHCGVRLRSASGEFPPVQEWPVCADEASTQLIFELPTGSSYVVYLSGDGLSQSSRVQDLRAVRWNTFAGDACGLCECNASLEGFPSEMGSEPYVSIEEYTWKSSSAWALTQLHPEVTQAGRHLRCIGPFRGGAGFAASIQVAEGASVRLRAEGSEDILSCGDQVLVPTESIEGVALVSSDGHLLLDIPFALRDSSSPTMESLHYLPGVALVRESALRRSGQLRAVVPNYGEIVLQMEDLQRLAPKLLGIQLLPLAECGQIEVRAGNASAQSELKTRIRSSRGAVVIEVPGNRVDESVVWTAKGLIPGSYDVLWSWGTGSACERMVRENVELHTGQLLKIDVSAPQISERPGEFVGWESLPPRLRATGISIEGQFAQVDGEGRFRMTVPTPPVERGGIYIPGRTSLLRDAVRIHLSDKDGSILARLDVGDVTLLAFELQNCSESEYAVEYWGVTEGQRGTLESPWGSTLTRTRPGESPVVSCGPNEFIVGCVWEWDGGGRGRDRLMGFISAGPADTPGKQIRCGGRWMQLQPKNREARLVDVAAVWLPRDGVSVLAALGRVALADSGQVWVPEEVQALRIRDGSGATVEVPIRAGDVTVIW